MAAQVALKRQQAAEDAIAIGLRAVATGTPLSYLPPGPIFGLPAMDSQAAKRAKKAQNTAGNIFHYSPQLIKIEKLFHCILNKILAFLQISH